MTRYLFILVAALAMVVGCKGGDATDGDADTEVNDTNDSMFIPDTNDNYAPDDECPNGPINSDCSMGVDSSCGHFSSECYDQNTRDYCDWAHEPCLTGTTSYIQNCGEPYHCITLDPCYAQCTTAEYEEFQNRLEGEWHETGRIECENGTTVSAVPMAMTISSINELMLTLGDGAQHAGYFSNTSSGIKVVLYSGTQRKGYASANTDYEMTLADSDNTMSLIIGISWAKDAFCQIAQCDACGHIFERGPMPEQPDDDVLLTDS